MNQKQIATKSVIYLIGNLSSKVISAILIPIYAFFISTSDLGTFDYSQSLMNVFVPILYISFGEGVLKFILTSDESDKPKIINITAVFGIISSFVYLLVCLIGYFFVETPAIWLSTWGMIIAHGITQIWQYSCRALQQTKHYLIISIASTIILLGATVFFVCILDMGLVGLYLSYILGQLTLLIGIEVKLHILKQISFKNFDLMLFQRVARFSIPLMFNTLSMWLVPLLMRTIIISQLGAEANGLYSFANKFNIVVNLLGTVVSMALVEEAIITSKNGKVGKDYGYTVTQIFVKFEQLSAVAIIAITVAYTFLSATEYYITIRYFGWFLCASLISILGSYIGTVFQSINITQYQFTTTLFGSAVGVTLAYFLVPLISLWGIVVGQMLSCIITSLSRYAIASLKSEFRIDWKTIIVNSIPVFIAVLLSTFCSNIGIKVFITIIFIIGVIILNYDIIKKLNHKIFHSRHVQP
ncbi:oligosaccharide flippase family protein [Eisenbergiella tayi]|uniref:Oligosaccharide flippase family protein n=1 Tax=Eisenbergiella porci TaxID=2652274 RepID=A0A6N7VV79_9FIRM|nr:MULTISPECIES: oligosaccharide flippase family protein [Eisenbergiella]MSS86919.1 oligosaccharide flippase family protein [Eisenbergiella porci]